MPSGTRLDKAGRWVALAVLGAATLGAAGARPTARSTQASGGDHAAFAPMAAASSDCSTDTTLCLGGGRFLVEATWTKPDGESGPAHAVALTADSGYFWFLEPNNVEVTVKALNGCVVDGHFWFFTAGLTNLEIQITVTDVITNTTKTYSNPQGTAFQPIADTGTFAGCPAATTASSGAPTEARAVTPRLQEATFARPDSASGCVTTDTTLCTGGRFTTSISFNANNESGSAHAVQLTPESGYFWFFDPSNIEIVVKTLDACSIGQGNWFFAAGMTTANVLVEVFDTLDNTWTEYHNGDIGPLFPPIQDTSAFPYCPGQLTHYTVSLSANPIQLYCENGLYRYTRYAFSKEIHARVGDTVTWEWTDRYYHSTTAADGSWDSGPHVGPFSFSHTFTEVGTFPYSCSVGHPSVDFMFSQPPPFFGRPTCSYVENFHEGSDVVVVAATAPTPSPTAAPSPTPTPGIATLTGIVWERCFVGSGDCPAANARVEAQGRTTYASGNGQFSLAGLTAGLTTVYARTADGHSESADVILTAGSNTVSIVLP
jgi:hypothetical protein